MTQFEAVIEYAGKRVKVKSDSFEELHAALAGIEELNQDAAFLRQERDIEDVIPVYRRDGDENEYFGLQDRHSRKNVTYGKKRGESMIPFFPKGAEGYYDPDAMGPRRPARSQKEEQHRAKPQGEPAGQEDRRPAQRETREHSATSRSDAQNGRPAPKEDLPF